MLRYAISDRTLFPGDERVRQARLIEQATLLAREGVDYFQLREKDLDDEALTALAVELRDAIRSTGARMQLVLNGPHRIAEHTGIAWHHATTRESDSAQSLSCSVHTLDDIDCHRKHGSLLLFAPVFGKTVDGKTVQPGAGIHALNAAVQRAAGTPVFALGGVTPQNASLCIDAGAAGIAGIRLFLRPQPRASLL